MLRLKVREVLEEKGVSMSKASRLADLSYNTILAICQHPDRDISINTLFKIAKALNVSMLDLVEEMSDDTD